MLHLFNGDAAAEVALRAKLPGEVAVWADTLDQGPLPSHLDGAALLEARAQSFALSEGGYGSLDEIRAKVSRWNAALTTAAEHAEVVLWFEHDLCCQLALLHHFDALESHPGVFVVCIGSHPAVPRFRGLSQLDGHQLGELFAGRAAVTAPQRALARVAWNAVRAASPAELWRLAQRDSPALPFLGPALRRLLEEYPDARGLSRTEAQILTAAAERPGKLGELFARCNEREAAPYLVDTAFAAFCHQLAGEPNPLLRLSGSAGPRRLDQLVQLTALGRKVTAGALNRVELRGIDRWIGGVHLTGSAPRYFRDGNRLTGC
ncbi:MAG TPA: hypothetical protein VN883_17280 [Myxococcales bacterium]|jgi:hypothetical protein|nr:hypothetical protein [Myxococcales bacterium]